MHSVSNLPDGLSSSFIGDNNLSSRLRYVEGAGGGSSASLQLRGILSEDEISFNKEIFHKVTEPRKAELEILNQAIDSLLEKAISEATALTREIQQQLFPIATAKDLQDLESLTATLTLPDQLSPKLTAFHNALIQALRRSAQHQVVLGALSNSGSLGTETLSYLLEHVIKDISGNNNGFEELISLHNSGSAINTGEDGLSAYVNPPTTDEYIFVSSTEQQPIYVDEVLLPLINDDSSWVTPSIALSVDKVYPVSLPSSSIKWKSRQFATKTISADVLDPSELFGGVRAVLSFLDRLSLIINALSLQREEIAFMNHHGEHSNGIKFSTLSLETLIRLADFAQIRKEGLVGTDSSSALSIMKWAFKASDSPPIKALDLVVERVAQITGWDSPVLNEVLPFVCGVTETDKIISSLRDDRVVVQLFKLMKTVKQIGIEAQSIKDLFSWAQPTETGYLFGPDQDWTICTSISQFARSRTNDTDWSKMIESINNQLRTHRRDSLIGFLIQQDMLKDWDTIDADSLFEFFLIDVQMSTSLSTSRIKQAISSVQLFIQRALLGLELDFEGSPFDIDRQTWEWMSKFRVWEAQRKIYLYPETYMKASLLDVKSAQYGTFESELTQSNVTLDTARSAFTKYLYRLNEIGDLKHVSCFREGTEDVYTLHIFSRTRHSPYRTTTAPTLYRTSVTHVCFSSYRICEGWIILAQSGKFSQQAPSELDQRTTILTSASSSQAAPRKTLMQME